MFTQVRTLHFVTLQSMPAVRALLALALALGLLLPLAVPASAATCSAYHVVQPGENLFRIGLKYNMSWIVIMRANGLSNPDRIYTGQTLCIPERGSGTIPVLDTDVKYVQALVNVMLRSGPGMGYAIIGQVFAGQTALVTGISVDRGWWRVVCPDGSIGNCFVSANPQFTQPLPSPDPSCTNRARFVADVTIPDDTNLEAGSAFVKTWRLRNAGTCTWGSGYSLVFAGGEQMGGPASAPLAVTVRPGEVVDVSVTLAAPLDPGAHRGYWQLRSADGSLFGIGYGGNRPFWVQVVSFWSF